MSAQGTESNEQMIAIPVRWDFEVELPTIYANQLLVTHGGGEFYLVFGESIPPVVLDPSREPLPEFVRIEPVARIVVSPQNMLKFAAAIQQNTQRFIDKLEGDSQDAVSDSEDSV